ncbi:sugar O-acetyltransferase [uncultured Sphaerochaeta sp.]|uniref:sugar O-acetyltransferase n=1 Tax=uncultured Sphaerochaeta sp. TaxID=886478 RepID=UPI002A0A9264|nr:sugar O-acetyltransferase [uncultured Sphaerochaeta sp.]
MTEIEKLDAGLEYCFYDDAVADRKIRAEVGCNKLNQVPPEDYKKRSEMLQELFGSCEGDAGVEPGFYCDNGKNIHVGKDFIANYNVVILDIRTVTIGDYCMIGPNTLITTVGHPKSPKKRRAKMAIASSVTIGNDVWIGGNCTILPGVTIGNNVIVAAGAVVTKDVPDNCVVAGIPAKIIQELEDDTDE